MEKFILSPADIEELADKIYQRISNQLKKPQAHREKPTQNISQVEIFHEKKYNKKDLISRRNAEIVLNLKQGTMDNPRYNEMCDMVKIGSRVYYTIDSVMNYKKNYSRK